MTQFHVYRLRDGRAVLDLQSDMVDAPTRVVAPLIPLAAAPPAFTSLEPVFEVAGTPHVLHTGEMAAIPARLLTREIGDLAGEDDRIRRALDFLFSGV